jgi:hypothetical protein
MQIFLKLVFLPLLVMALIFGSSLRAAELIPLFYDERPPFFVTKTKGHPDGLMVALTQDIFQRAGIEFAWYRMPTKRILETLKAQDMRACSPGWYRTSDRITVYKFTKPIYVGRPQIALLGPGVPMPKPPIGANLMAGPAILLKKDGLKFSDAVEHLVAQRDPAKIHSVTFDASDLPRLVAEGQNLFTIMPGEQMPDRLDPRLQAVALSDITETAERYIMCGAAVGDDLIKRLDSVIPNVHSPKSE